MNKAFMSDLRASQDPVYAITIRMWTGHEFLTGVKDLNQDDEALVVYNLQTLSKLTRSKQCSSLTSSPSPSVPMSLMPWEACQA